MSDTQDRKSAMDSVQAIRLRGILEFAGFVEALDAVKGELDPCFDIGMRGDSLSESHVAQRLQMIKSLSRSVSELIETVVSDPQHGNAIEESLSQRLNKVKRCARGWIKKDEQPTVAEIRPLCDESLDDGLTRAINTFTLQEQDEREKRIRSANESTVRGMVLEHFDDLATLYDCYTYAEGSPDAEGRYDSLLAAVPHALKASEKWVVRRAINLLEGCARFVLDHVAGNSSAVAGIEANVPELRHLLATGEGSDFFRRWRDEIRPKIEDWRDEPVATLGPAPKPRSGKKVGPKRTYDLRKTLDAVHLWNANRTTYSPSPSGKRDFIKENRASLPDFINEPDDLDKAMDRVSPCRMKSRKKPNN